MAQTRHIQKTISASKMRQVAEDFFPFPISSDLDNPKISKKEFRSYARMFRQHIATLEKIEARGGIVVVVSNGHEITTYPLNSYRR